MAAETLSLPQAGGLLAILLLTLVLPLRVRRVEHNLEAFLLAMGVSAVTVSGLWSVRLVSEALWVPIEPRTPIVEAVLLFGLVFHYARRSIRSRIQGAAARVSLPLFLFLVTVGLGLLASIVTAIMASLLLVEIVSGLRLSKGLETRLVILACFSIGIGAALTPVGEPLSTIVVSKLSGPPYNADFFFLARLLWPWIVAGVLAMGVAAIWLLRTHPKPESGTLLEEKYEEEPVKTVPVRAAKVYMFVGALVLLGAGFQPAIDLFVVGFPAAGLYWLNTVSAVLDNATLAAAEISAKMAASQIEAALLGLLISGGMLIPGNIPNIIAASHLKIPAREWARFGVPVGLAMLTVYFGALLVAGL